MRTLIWTILLWFGFVSTANTQEIPERYRAERMLELCKGMVRGEDKNMQSMVCTFRLQGVASIMIENCVSISHGFNPLPLFASEKPPSRKATRKAFTNFMEANPDKWGISWHIAVSMALSEYFPCRR